MLKPWLVRPPNESDCTVLDCSSPVKRVSTRSCCSDLDAAFFLFFLERRDVEGEEKSCRPPLGTSHVHQLFLSTVLFLASTCPLEKTVCIFFFHDSRVKTSSKGLALRFRRTERA